MKSFWPLLKESFKEYKENFLTLFSFLIIFSFIPGFILFFFETPLRWNLYLLGKNPQFFDMIKVILGYKYLILLVVLELIAFLLSTFMYVSFIYCSLYKKKKMKFNDCFNGGKKYFLYYLGFSIVAGIFLILLFALLIIPGIIFLVFWIFSPFILIAENKDIFSSLRTSRRLVKRKWWKTFGFLALFLLLVIIVSIAVSIVPSTIIYIITLSDTSYKSYFISSLLLKISGFIIGLITIPTGVFFIKNLYLDYKKK